MGIIKSFKKNFTWLRNFFKKKRARIASMVSHAGKTTLANRIIRDWTGMPWVRYRRYLMKHEEQEDARE